jgi:hypothetical protein
MPERIQRKRTKGWRMPENTVSVARPGFFGNPFKVGDYTECQYAVDAYRDWLKDTPQGRYTQKKAIELLKGKNLACFCPLNQPCHADVLLELANK